MKINVRTEYEKTKFAINVIATLRTSYQVVAPGSVRRVLQERNIPDVEEKVLEVMKFVKRNPQGIVL